jgi:hypothetical protein
MNKELQHVKDVLSPSDFKNLLEAAKITNGDAIKLGMFISTSLEQYAKVVTLLEPLVEHHDSLVRGTAKKIKQTARDLSRQGMFGDGMFLAK